MKVLMVCLGNICRSPMAEGVLRDMAGSRGLDIVVDSAGTSNYHVGEAPDGPIIRYCMSSRSSDMAWCQWPVITMVALPAMSTS